MRSAIRRPAFGGLLLAILVLMTLSEITLGAVTYGRLRTVLEADLAQRLVHVARLIAIGTDVPLVTQFREGDDALPAHQLVTSRLVRLAQAAGVERAYVVDGGLHTLVDSSPGAAIGRTRYALLANRVEVDAAKAGVPTPTRLYQDEEGRLRLSALTPLRASDGRVVALAGVDAAPEFFASLDTLRRQMTILGLASVITAGAGGLLLVRQASRRLKRLREIVSRVSRGDFADRVGVTGSDEISALGQDLDGMVTSLVETRDYYESVLASADVGLLATDREGRVIGANARAARILAADGTELAGRLLAEILAGAPRLLAFAATLLHGGSGPFAEEIPLGGGPASGGRVVAAVASRLLQGGEWTGMILSISDVTDLRALERRLRRNEQLAGLGSMAAGLLHEVRNPLASMTMYLDLLRPLAAAGEGQDLVDRAIKEAERLDRFLHDFQIFAGLRPLRREWVDLRTVVEEGIDGLSPPPGVTIVHRLGEETVLYLDRSLLAHAVRNLVANAIEAVGVKGRIVLELGRPAKDVVLSVTDDGIGVPEPDLERIFDPLFTTKPTGTGLGLTIVQRVAEAHGATVDVRKAVPRGATFALRWPAASLKD